MRKLLIPLIFISQIANAQFEYPTEFLWQFINGLETNRINSYSSTRLGINVAPLQDFHVLADTVRFEGLDGTGTLLGIDANGIVNKTTFSVSGLTPTEILFGAADGSIDQSNHLTFDDANEILLFGNNAVATSTFQVTSLSDSRIEFQSNGNGLALSYNDLNSRFQIENGSFPLTMTVTGRTGLRINTPLQDLHFVGDTLRLEGLDGTGTFLGIDANGDVTKTTVTGFGDVFKVGTPVNNQIGVWTGDGTIEGEASLTYDATAGFDLANSFDAQWSTTGSGTLITANLSNASATGKLIDLQHDEVTKFQVTYTGSTVIGKTSVDAVHALKAGQLGVGATGDVFQMANASGNTTTFTVDGKIDLYATEVPANGEILIGDGTDMELATLTAGEDITITNAAGSITIASTFNQDAGEYTPTATLVTNLDAVTFTNCQWHRTGSYVFGTANLTIDPTASGGIEFTFNIPIASNFAATTNALGGGFGNSTSTGTKGIITANVAGDVLQFNASTNHTASVTYNLSWSYKIL